MIYLVSFVLVLCLVGGMASADPLQQDPGPDGIVSVEAEHFDGNVERSGVKWVEVGPTGGFTGTAGMQVLGVSFYDSGYAAGSPQLEYEINFVKTGTHYVWILAWGAGGSDDSCHVGLDGEETPLSNRMTGWSNSYGWENSRYQRPEPSQIDITTSGLHVLNIWVREDGLIVDKIVLTTNPNYTPTGDGPAESNHGPMLKAYNPTPDDGVLYEDTWVSLSWSAGETAASHDVYFGENFDDVSNGTGGTFQGNQGTTNLIVGSLGSPYPDGLVPGTTYYWRIDEVNDLDPNSPYKGDVWSFMTAPGYATQPDPANNAVGVAIDATLSWLPGLTAATRDVYFGTSSPPAFIGKQEAATYYPGPLEPGTTYYWQTDEIEADGTTIYTGDIWSFTTAPGYATQPDPANDGLVVALDTTLSWLPGPTAATRDVYFGTSSPPPFIGNQAESSFDPNGLEPNTTYYWQIDEIEADGTTIYTGDIWSFTTYAAIENVEDFETGDFSRLPWEHGGDENWAVTSRQKHSGAYSAKAGAIEDGGNTTLQLTLDCVSGNITFYRKVSSESNFDYLKFYIDGVEKGRWSGEEDWAQVSFGVTAGTRIFEWTYSKDGSVSEGNDTVWIDDIVFPVVILSEAPWRSSLYPEDWTPGYKDSQSRFLHNFSYAGYHSGEAGIPLMTPGPVVDVIQSPYNADNTGTTDATSAIQAAIDAVGVAGGGIVYLPVGTYKLKPPTGSNYALRIRHSGVVLRGAGPGETFLFNDETYMRMKSVILVKPTSGRWHSPLSGTVVDITRDVYYPTHIIPVAVRGARTKGGEWTTRFKVGDWVILRTDCTDSFIAEHGMTGLWNSGLKGITFYRRVTAIDPRLNSISVDIPTRYYLKTRDNARVYKVAPHLEEVGIECLSIGMRENLTGGLGALDYSTPGTAAYEVHGSHFIQFYHVVNGWMQDIHTYRPAVNTNNWHTLSNIIQVSQSRNVTVRNCVVARPEYEGGGGNGYGYTLGGSDCLLIDCTAYHTRHNYALGSMWTSGNVIFRCETRDGHLASDFHMHLSPANLFDSMFVDGDYLDARYRPYGTTIHGHTTTESVFWNTYGTERCGSRLIVSRQWKWGYVIGTRGPVHNVERGTQDNTAPEDFLEGEGQGWRLVPQSLYLDQLYRRPQSDPTKARDPSPADGGND